MGTAASEISLYHFYIKDHLGNNRMVLSASGAVEQVVHYYPYGMSFADGTNADAQRFKYNGKELDAEDGLNWMDYGARMYDAALARWGGVNALAEKYSSYSPYNYCVSNPVKFVDLDGKDGKATVDHGNNTIEIEQTFYYNKNNRDLSAILTPKDLDHLSLIKENGFDNNGQPWSLDIGKEKWKVDFITNFIGLNNDEEVNNALENDNFGNIITYEFGKTSKNPSRLGKQVNGSIIGNKIVLTQNSLYTNSEDIGTFVHEQGHTLGLKDTSEKTSGAAMSYSNKRRIKNEEVKMIVQPIIESHKTTYIIRNKQK